MGCEHKQPLDLIELAEGHLNQENVPVDKWPGLRFGWGENVETMWRSVWMEIERRGDQWIVTKIDRSKDPLPDERLGFQPLVSQAVGSASGPMS